MIVAREDHDAAQWRGACEIGVFEGIARAVDTRPLAVPETEYTVVARAVEQADLLGSPQRGRREFLVDAGLEGDPVVLEQRGLLPELEIETAQRRTAVSGNEACCVAARSIRRRSSGRRTSAWVALR